MAIVKRKKDPMENLEVSLPYLHHLKKQKEALEKEIEELGNLIKKITPVGFELIVETEEGLRRVVHEQSTTPILTDDMAKAEKKLGKGFKLCVNLSVTKVRELFGDTMIACLKVDERKTDSLKFYKVKE